MSVRALDRWHGNQVLLSELTDELLNRWLLSMEDELAPKSIRRRRGDVLALWRHAEFVGAVEGKPERIRKVKVPKQIPDCFSMNELVALLAACESFGEYLPNGIKLGAYLFAFINTAYDSALRFADLMRERKSSTSCDNMRGLR